MLKSSAITQLDTGAFSPAQKAIFLATMVKNLADEHIVYARNYALQLTGISEGFKLPEFNLVPDASVELIKVEKNNGVTEVRVPIDLNRPDSTSTLLIFRAVGMLLDPKPELSDDDMKIGIKWINEYHAKVTKEYQTADMFRRREILLPIAKVLLIYFQNVLPKFVDQFTEEDEFINTFIDGVHSEKAYFDNDMNAGIIRVLFGTTAALDYFNIYTALLNSPIDGTTYLKPSTAEFMSAYHLACVAGI